MNNDIELKSEKVRNLVGKMPPILLRMGTGVISIVILMFCIILYYVPYQQKNTFPIQIQYNSTDYYYYATAEISITKGKIIKTGMPVTIVMDCLGDNYSLQGDVEQVIEKKGKVSVVITITNSRTHTLHLNTSPCGSATITTYKAPFLKRIIKEMI